MALYLYTIHWWRIHIHYQVIYIVRHGERLMRLFTWKKHSLYSPLSAVQARFETHTVGLHQLRQCFVFRIVHQQAVVSASRLFSGRGEISTHTALKFLHRSFRNSRFEVFPYAKFGKDQTKSLSWANTHQFVACLRATFYRATLC